MLSLAKDFAPWFLNLAKPLQDLICTRAAELTTNIFKKLIITPLDIIEKLFASGEKITLATINKALAAIFPPEEKQIKLRKNGYAQVIVAGHPLEGKIGQVSQHSVKHDNVVLQMFVDGPDEPFKLSEIKPVPKPATQEVHEKDQKIKYYESVLESDFIQQEELISQGNTRSEGEIEEALLAKLKEEVERKTADEIALIKATIDERVRDRLQEREQEIERREQELQQREQEQRLRERQQEEARVQAQQLEAAQAEAKRWQERVQDLEKALSRSQNLQHENLDEYDVVTTDNSQLVKQVEFLLEKNADLEKKLAEQETAAAPFENSSSETIAEPENLEVLTEELSTALELFGIRGWGPDGYRARNKRMYTGAMAIKAFLEDEFSGNDQPPERQRSVNSADRFAEYSGKIQTPA